MTDPGSRIPPPMCTRTGRWTFLTERAALNARSADQTVHLCQHCRGWHLVRREK